MKRELLEGKVKLYSRTGDGILRDTGSTIEATMIEIGDPMVASHEQEDVMVVELYRKGIPTGFVVKRIEMDAVNNQEEVRHATRGPLMTTAR